MRTGGYADIRDYAVIGDGRAAALVARDGAIDWLCMPDLDSPSVFGALLDAERGGSFQLCPSVPHSVERRYRPGTNVLETTFHTQDGAVRVVDAMTTTGPGLAPLRELARRVEGLSGEVPLTWRVEPRFGYAERKTRIERRLGVPVATAAAAALAVQCWNAPESGHEEAAIAGRIDVRAGESALIALAMADREPLVLSSREEVEARIEATARAWAQWSAGREYAGAWQGAVLRSALALKLLVHAPSGAVAAAATTSLPEEIGGERNWDYRFCWVRDSAFTLGAFLGLGCGADARAYFWWLMQASQLTHPRLRVLYGLDGGAHAPERLLTLGGYRGSSPVRVGNAAASQVQLDTYGELLQTAWLYAAAGHRIDADVGQRLAEIADLVCRLWRLPDAGIWEVRSVPRHFTQSKMMCWVALDRARDLAERGLIPDRHAQRWRQEATLIEEFVETQCFSPEKRSYVRHAGSGELDASLLLGVLMSYGAPTSDRWSGTVEALRRELRDGPFVRRYSGEDGLGGSEGAFLACSFWLAEALARSGRVEDAAALMDELVGLANDVGLYAEEIDPATGAFLGNLPQGLSHLALISAALAIDGAADR
ncbi:MAG TPA: glycoside hydrolase family 15 protein [Solirubrobacteraceae bacterium]|nr:glycoside hydrolase family 15 protein [Solirubrobacteraceae bacterium]